MNGSGSPRTKPSTQSPVSYLESNSSTTRTTSRQLTAPVGPTSSSSSGSSVRSARLTLSVGCISATCRGWPRRRPLPGSCRSVTITASAAPIQSACWSGAATSPKPELLMACAVSNSSACYVGPGRSRSGRPSSDQHRRRRHALASGAPGYGRAPGTGDAQFDHRLSVTNGSSASGRSGSTT